MLGFRRGTGDRAPSIALGAAVVLGAVLPGTAGAASVTPDTGLDTAAMSSDCSLREAIHYLNTAGTEPDDSDACVHTGTFGVDDTVVLTAGTEYTLSIAGDDEQLNFTGDLDVFDDLTIAGDAGDPPTIRSTVDDRVLDTPNPSNLTLESLTVEDGQLNSAVEQLGANIRFRGANGDTLTLDDVTVRDGFTGAGTDVQGGGVSAQEGGHVVIENGSLITENRVGPGAAQLFTGGGVHIGGVGTDLSVSDSEISANEAGVGNNVVTPVGGAGGGIYSDATGASAIILDNATIDGNRAGGGDSSTGTTGTGGGIALGQGGGGSTSSLQVTGGSVTDNAAAGGFGAGQGRGGGIFAESAAAGLGLDGVTVTGNHAGGDAAASAGDGLGGGIYSDRDLSIVGGSVSMNQAGAGQGATGIGGGVHVSSPAADSDLSLEDTSVSNNVAGEFLVSLGGSGGGVAMTSTGTLTVTGSTISGNNAYQGQGGGIYRESLAPSLDDSISRSTIRANAAPGGGGIFIREEFSPLKISESTVSTNGATGGAADGGGGGIYTQSDLTATNLTVANNHAIGAGGPVGGGLRTAYPVSASAPTVVLDHTTFAGNATSGTGGHLFLVGGVGDASVRASILGLGQANGAPTTSACSQETSGLIDSGGFNLELSTDQCGFDASGDLALVSTQDAGLGLLGANGGPTETIPLAFGSVAIDRVTTGCPPPATDQRGVARPQSVACDSGAYEFPGRTLTASVTGTGTGILTGTGISCPGDCTQALPEGTVVTLTAAATNGTFTGWSGACSGTGACTVTLDSDKAVTAGFAAPVVPRAASPKCKKGFKFKKIKKKGKKPRKKCVKVKKKRKK